MFSAHFLGKHLLIILLAIALGGAISIAAIPQLREPVTNYFGEKFGPKADEVLKDPLAPCDFSAKPSSDVNFSGPDFAEVGSNIIVSYHNNDTKGRAVAFETDSSKILVDSQPNTAVHTDNLHQSNYGYGPGYIFREPTHAVLNNNSGQYENWLDQRVYQVTYQITKPMKSGLAGVLDYINGVHRFYKSFYSYYNGVNIALTPLDKNGIEITTDNHLFDKNTASISKKFKVKATYNGQPLAKDSKIKIIANLFEAITDQNSPFYNASLAQMPYGEVTLNDQGEGIFTFTYSYSYSNGNAIHSFTGINRVDATPSNFTVSYNRNRTSITFTQKVASQSDLTYQGGVEFIALNADDCKKDPTRVKYYRSLPSAIKLNAVDPSDEAKAKTTAKADGQDKIKVKIDFKNGDGTINNAQNVQVYANAGKLSMTGDADKFSSYSADSTLSLLGNREFYILNNKAEKATISAKTLDQEGQELLASTEVEFKEPTLSHEVDKTEADNDGKDYITYTLTVFDVDGITPLADQTVDMSFIMSKGEIEESQFSDFSYSQKFAVLKNEKEEILSDPQLLEGLKTDNKGKVSLYIRSKDNSQAKLTGLLHFADRTIGTNDKDFKSIAFKGARIVLTGEDKTEYTYSEGNFITNDNIQTLKLKFTDKDNNPIKNAKISFLVSTESDNLDKSCIVEKLDSKGVSEGIQSVCNQSSDDFVTDTNGELSIGISTKIAGKLSITAQGTKDKLISSNTVDIEYIAENLTLTGKTTAPANAKVSIVLAAEFFSSDVQSKNTPKISFEISPKDKNMEIKLNNVKDRVNWYETETDWINVNQFIDKSMFKKDDSYARSIAIRTDTEGEYEITATVTLENGKSYQEKKTIKFLESETTIKPTKITREVNGKTVSLDFQKTKDSQTPIFPGDLVKFEVSSKYNDKQLTMQVNLPENIQIIKDSFENGEYVDANKSIIWQNFSDPITFEVQIYPEVPIKTTDLEFIARLICSDPENLKEILISKSSVDIDIWSKVKGQVTEPYAIQNGSFVLSDNGNRPVQNMEIELLNGANVKISGKETITTDQGGNFEFEFARKSLSDDNQVKYQLKLNVFNNKLFTDLANMDRLITVTGSDRKLTTEGFALEDIDITNQDFKIRNKDSEPKIQKTGSTEENKTLLSVTNNILEAMKITKKYVPSFKYQNIIVSPQQNKDNYMGDNNIVLSTANSTKDNQTLKLLINRSAIAELHEFSHYLFNITGGSLEEGFAIANSVYLQNEILHGSNFSSWIHTVSFSDGFGYNLYNIMPAFSKEYDYKKEFSVASIFHLLTTGYLGNSLNLDLKNLVLNITKGKDVWFDPNLNMNFPVRSSYGEIVTNTANFYDIIFDQRPPDMSDFFNYAIKIPDWNKNVEGSNLPIISQLYILGGLFSDTNNNGIYDEGEKIGPGDSTATGTSTTTGGIPARMPLRVENSYLKINLLSPSDLSQDYTNYLNVLVDSNNKDSTIQLVDENGHLVDTSSKFVFSNNNGLLYLTPSPEEYKEKIFITSLDSANYIILDADKFRQAVEAANTNGTGNGYVAEANFNIQLADLEKGILAATPPSLEQMQAMEAEKEKIKAEEQAKALEAQKLAEEAAKAQDEAQKAELERQVREAEEARLKALEELKIAQEAQLRVQAAQLKAEQEKAAEIAKLEAERQAEIEKNQKIAEENTKLQKQLADYQAQIDSLNAKLTQTQFDLVKARTEKDEILNQKDALVDDLATAREENNILNRISINLQQSVLSLQEQLKNLNISYLSGQESNQQERLNSLQQKKELLELTDTNTEIKEQLEDQLSTNSDLTQQNTDLLNQIDSQNDQITKSQITINKLQLDLNTTQDKLVKIQTEKADLEKQNTNLVSQIQKAQENHDLIDQINLTLQKTVNNLQLKLKEQQEIQAQKEEELRLEKINNQLLEQENQQKELANLQLQQELKQKELELQNQQTNQQVTIEQDKQTILNNESPKNIDKLDQEIKKVEQEKEQITNKIDQAIDQTPLIDIRPVQSSSETLAQTQRQEIKIATVQDDTTHLSGISSQTISKETLETKTNQELIVNADNFKNTDNIKVFLDDQQIAETPILTDQTDLKITVPDTTLGAHTITVKDDLGNQAQEEIKISQNKYWNINNLGYGIGTIIMIMIGLFTIKILSSKVGVMS